MHGVQIARTELRVRTRTQTLLSRTKLVSTYDQTQQNSLVAGSEKQCYVMLWPALTWRGQEWAQHVQGQLLHTSIMQIAGSPHVMELLTVSI